MLTAREIEFVTRKWIGVQGGYLGDFSYRTHYEFYDEYCGLPDINPYKMQGTTRSRFEIILAEATPDAQSRILKGVLKKYPLGSAEYRTQNQLDRLLEFIKRCEGGAPVSQVMPVVTSAVVERALADAETLLTTTGATSALDRVHTALHGYLKEICRSHKIEPEKDAPTTRLFKLLRAQCPEFLVTAHGEQSERVLSAIAQILDAMNPLRNRGSVAHPNERLLDNPEAMLCINATRTVFHYLNSKIKNGQTTSRTVFSTRTDTG